MSIYSSLLGKKITEMFILLKLNTALRDEIWNCFQGDLYIVESKLEINSFTGLVYMMVKL